MFLKFRKVNINLLGTRIFKLINIIFYPSLWKFLKHGIMPAFEHVQAIKKTKNINSLVDCGSNKGQFAIILFFFKKYKKYLCFDPIIEPLTLKKFIQKRGLGYKYFNIGLSNKSSKENFYITKREDSSSLKKKIDNSSIYFPDVYFEKSLNINVRQLSEFKDVIENMPEPRALKIDVQGAELDLIKGSNKILNKFKYVFIEISFFNIYLESGNYEDIFEILHQEGFKEIFSYNKLKSRKKLISKDYLFKK